MIKWLIAQIRGKISSCTHKQTATHTRSRDTRTRARDCACTNMSRNDFVITCLDPIRSVNASVWEKRRKLWWKELNDVQNSDGLEALMRSNEPGDKQSAASFISGGRIARETDEIFFVLTVNKKLRWQSGLSWRALVRNNTELCCLPELWFSLHLFMG